MRAVLILVCVFAIASGLWNHDWTAIGAGVLLAVIWPVIADDVKREGLNDRQRRELLDRLWDDDDDLPRSA